MATTPNTAITYLDPGTSPTCSNAAAVTGKTFVVLAAGGKGNHPAVAKAGADALVYGVAQNDSAAGGQVVVLRQGCYSVTAGVALTSGDVVYSDANGKAIKTGTVPAGQCTADTASGGDAPIQLRS